MHRLRGARPDLLREHLLMAAAAADGEPVLDVAADTSMTDRSVGPRTLRPILQADVEAIRDDLAAWPVVDR